MLAVTGITVTVFTGVAFAVVRAGDNGTNGLVGTAENDTLRGLDEADTLIGRGAFNRLFGGGGNDLKNAWNAWERERAEDELVDCGAGRGTVLTDNTIKGKIHPSQIRAR